MEYRILTQGDKQYPRKLLTRMDACAPSPLYYHGPLKLLDRFSMGVLSSDLIPGRAMLEANQLLFTIRDYAINYVGGWHSVMETEIFRLGLYRNNDPNYLRSVTMCTARGIQRETWDGFLADRFGGKGPFTGFPEKEEFYRRAKCGELLVLSIVEPTLKRMTRNNVIERNVLVCMLSDIVFIPSALKGSKTLTVCKRILEAGIPIFTSIVDDNKDLHALGIPALDRKNVGKFLEGLGAKTTGETPFPASCDENGLEELVVGGTKTTNGQQQAKKTIQQKLL